MWHNYCILFSNEYVGKDVGPYFIAFTFASYVIDRHSDIYI